LPRTFSDDPLRLAPDGLRVTIRLSPRARSDRLLGIAAIAGGGRVVKAAVTEPAEGGRANEALLRLLTVAWRLPRKDLSIVAGITSRNKTVRVAGDPRQLIARLSAEIASLPGP
jgi:uncharacterized protein (TIGR00251 family)